MSGDGHRPSRNPAWAFAWVWNVCGAKAEHFLNVIYGYLSPRRRAQIDAQVSASRVERPHRTARGERNSQAKLTWAIVEEVRRRHTIGRLDRRMVAREFGVNPSTIDRVVTGRYWIKR